MVSTSDALKILNKGLGKKYTLQDAKMIRDFLTIIARSSVENRLKGRLSSILPKDTNNQKDYDNEED